MNLVYFANRLLSQSLGMDHALHDWSQLIVNINVVSCLLGTPHFDYVAEIEPDEEGRHLLCVSSLVDVLLLVTGVLEL
jgi:hypothetical protein